MDNSNIQRAVDKEDEAIKKLVLKLLHLNGIMAVDAAESILDKDLERVITPPNDGMN